MTCVHKVRWSVKRPEDCRFRLSVSHYKDRIVAPDEYSGATVVTPSDDTQVLATKNKLVKSNITVNPAPAPDLRLLTIDSLTQHGTFLPTGDGFSQVTVEEQWDGTLYPTTDESDSMYDLSVFNAKRVRVYAGETVIVEGYGRGRILGFRGEKTLTVEGLPNTVNINLRSDPIFDYMRYKFDIPVDCILVVAGYYSSPDGGHSGNTAYVFRGEWVRWKVIHAS